MPYGEIICRECRRRARVFRSPSQDPAKFCSRECTIRWRSTIHHEDIARFWSLSRREDNGCWMWQGARRMKRGGYGTISMGGTEYLAHRLAWRITQGVIPAGLFVCHHCDTPQCIRPDHLFLGTHTENMNDMAAKGRHWKQRKVAE